MPQRFAAAVMPMQVCQMRLFELYHYCRWRCREERGAAAAQLLEGADVVSFRRLREMMISADTRRRYKRADAMISPFYHRWRRPSCAEPRYAAEAEAAFHKRG